jgi:amino acid transporter
MTAQPSQTEGRSSVSTTGDLSHHPHLRRGSIGLVGVLFQAITYMAPGVGIAFSLGIAVPISGATLPLSVIVALIACMFTAVAIGQLAKHIPSAGGIYTYAARGIGARAGFLVGWFYVAFAVFMPGSLLTLGGWFISGFVKRELGVEIGWEIWGILFAVAVFLLTYYDVRMSARATIILGAVEIGVFVALACYMVATRPNSAAPFTPSAGADGWSGILRGAVFAILAFIGFEAAAALGEEARNPRRTVPVGVIGSCVLVGIFYVFMTYAWNVGAEMNIIKHNTASANSDWEVFGGEYWGRAGAWIMFLALCNSIVACGIAVTNNAARVLFAMGRAGSAPSFLGKVHPKHRSPYMAVIATLAVTGVVAYALAWTFGSVLGPGTEGLVGFVVEATFFTVIAILIYVFACAACVGYFAGEGRTHRRTFRHVIAPVIGILTFVLPLYTQYFDLTALFNGSPFHWAHRNASGAAMFFSREIPATVAVVGAIVWVIAGIVLALYLAARHPHTLERSTHAFGGEVDEASNGTAESMSIMS